MLKKQAPKGVSEEVFNLPETHHLSYSNVRSWIKYNREVLKEERQSLRAGVKGSESRVKSAEGYIRNLEKYIRDGDYCDDFYGQDQQSKITWVCKHPAYDSNGKIKRQHGVYYEDLGYVYGRENEDG